MEGNFFKWLSIVEGAVIVCMLGWEIFWLRRMYQVLWAMPTAKQIKEMVEMIQKDKESVVGVMNTFSEVFSYGKAMMNGLLTTLGKQLTTKTIVEDNQWANKE